MHKHEGFWQCMDTQRDHDQLNQAVGSQRQRSLGLVGG